MNKKQIYRIINDCMGISRVKIAGITKLSKTTVSALVDELIREGYIIDEGAIESKRQGRKPNSLIVNYQLCFIVVINCHKHNLEIALVNSAIHIIFCREVPLTDSEDYIAQLKIIFENFITDNCIGLRILGVCVVVPGIVDAEKEKIISLVLSLEDDNHAIQQLREAISDYPLAIFNDSACLAYAENIFGAMQKDNGAYININEGVGAALYSDGKMFRGANGMATQFGHFSIDPKGAACICGNRGCLENAIGELALEKRIKENGLTNLFKDKKPILFRDVGDLAKARNEPVLQMLDQLALDFSYGLGNLITLFHPKLIIIGGTGRKLGLVFLDNVKRHLKATGFQPFVMDVDIQYTKLDEGAVLRGAAKYFLDTHFNFEDTTSSKLFLY